MAFLLRHLATYAVRKIASDPEARAKAARAAKTVGDEAKQIVRDEDPARAAGRAMRRFLNNFDEDKR
jgi:hypothetical protein